LHNLDDACCRGALVMMAICGAPPAPAAAQQGDLTPFLRRVAAGESLSRPELLRMRQILEARVPVTANETLAAMKERQDRGMFSVTDAESSELLKFARQRWPEDAQVAALFRDWLGSFTPETLADLALRADTPWDDQLVEPTVKIIEDAAGAPSVASRASYERYLLVDRGLSLLDRHHESWKNSVAIPSRLTKAALQVAPLAPAGFYGTVETLKKTHDRGAVDWLRPFLDDKTLDVFTTESSNMPGGVTPMRRCDLAANGILNLLGEPEFADPWNRARAPRGGPYPEWETWDRKIETLRARLAASLKP
jgi:hypothetical protein